MASLQNTVKQSSTRLRSLDVLKCIAILGVLFDHLYGIFYESEKLWNLTLYAVPLFVLLMGVTTYRSFDDRKTSLGKIVLKRLIGILVPYAVAVLIYNVVMFWKIDWKLYYEYFTHFNISLPHYYVLLYCQLILVAPVLFFLLKKCDSLTSVKRVLAKTAMGLVIACLVRFLNRHSNILDIHGGGGKLLGGGFLLVLYIGMIFGANLYRVKELSAKTMAVLAAVFAVCTAVVFVLIYKRGLFLDSRKLLGTSINPPGITLIVCVGLVLLMIVFCDSLLTQSPLKITNRIADFLALIGRNTLHIFLYHRLFLDYFLEKYLTGLPALLKLPVYLIVMILGSIIIGKAVEIARKIVVQSYTL